MEKDYLPYYWVRGLRPHESDPSTRNVTRGCNGNVHATCQSSCRGAGNRIIDRQRSKLAYWLRDTPFLYWDIDATFHSWLSNVISALGTLFTRLQLTRYLKFPSLEKGSFRQCCILSCDNIASRIIAPIQVYKMSKSSFKVS